MTTATETKDKREHILDVAARLFSEHGFAGTSTRQLAKEADVNLGMLTYYFGNKESILLALFQKHKGSEADTIASIIETTDLDPFERIDSLIECYIQKFFRNPDLMRFVHREMSLPTKPPIMQDMMDKILGNRNRIKAFMEACAAQGIFRRQDFEMLLSSFFGSVFLLINNPHYATHWLGVPTDEAFSPQMYHRIVKHFQSAFRVQLQP